MLIPGALLQSLAAFIAQNVGAGDEKRSQKAMLTGMASGSAVGILIIAAIITPTTDAFTLFIVALPIWLLYEMSIVIVKNE